MCGGGDLVYPHIAKWDFSPMPCCHKIKLYHRIGESLRFFVCFTSNVISNDISVIMVAESCICA
jgi:hypothetical protein